MGKLRKRRTIKGKRGLLSCGSIFKWKPIRFVNITFKISNVTIKKLVYDHLGKKI